MIMLSCNAMNCIMKRMIPSHTSSRGDDEYAREIDEIDVDRLKRPIDRIDVPDIRHGFDSINEMMTYSPLLSLINISASHDSEIAQMTTFAARLRTAITTCTRTPLQASSSSLSSSSCDNGNGSRLVRIAPYEWSMHRLLA